MKNLDIKLANFMMIATSLLAMICLAMSSYHFYLGDKNNATTLSSAFVIWVLLTMLIKNSKEKL
ncbi:MAG: hypothetical protein Q4G13_02300 [Moraxella sp.]|nr:hypothetical protein [Moraxella sp.]